MSLEYTVDQRDYDGDLTILDHTVSLIDGSTSTQITDSRVCVSDVEYVNNETVQSVIENLEKRIAELEEQKQDVKHIKVSKDEAVIFMCKDDVTDEEMHEIYQALFKTIPDDMKACLVKEKDFKSVVKLSKEEVHKHGGKLKSINGNRLQSKRRRRLVRVLGRNGEREKES